MTKGIFDDLVGSVCSFRKDPSSKDRLAGRIVSWEIVEPQESIPDCSIVVEGSSGRRLSLESFNDHSCKVFSTWEEATAFAEEEVEDFEAMEDTEILTLPPFPEDVDGQDASEDLRETLERVEAGVVMILVHLTGKTHNEAWNLMQRYVEKYGKRREDDDE